MRKKINWPIWTGFVISIIALLSYPFVFVNWAATRDFPWANIALFMISDVFVVIGLRRAFRPDRGKLAKVVASLLTMLSALVFGLFIFSAFIAARWLPASPNAPQVGSKAPEFSLVDTTHKSVSLSELLSQPVNNRPPKGVLLIFYRGYW